MSCCKLYIASFFSSSQFNNLGLLQSRIQVEKTAITAADHLNDRVLPFFESQGIPLLRILTDRGTEYCGKPEHHAYQLYLGIENIDRADRSS